MGAVSAGRAQKSADHQDLRRRRAQYLAWCAEQKRAADLSKSSVYGFVASLLDRGNAPATARARQLAVRRFAAWLVEEEEMAVDPLLGIKAPQLDSKVIEPLTEAQLKALLKACAGPDMRDRRDEAILRLMLETGPEPARSSGLPSRTSTL